MPCNKIKIFTEKTQYFWKENKSPNKSKLQVEQQ